MKLIEFFRSFGGRIDRQTFWLMSIAVLAVELVAVLIATGLTAALSLSDKWIAIVAITLVYPQFAIDVKRGHDRNIPMWAIGAFYAVAIVRGVLIEFGWLTTRVNQNTFSYANVTSFAFTMLIGIAAIALLVELGFRKGSEGPNRYGPDPLAKA
jgi:uncharacterized membrane protein YhaH (DUF805 family)